MEEDAAGAGQLLGHDRVQQPGGDTALDDDPAEARVRGGPLVVVEGVAVARELAEELDVLRANRPCPGGGLVAAPVEMPFPQPKR